MKTLITEFISLDSVVQAPAGRKKTRPAASPLMDGFAILCPEAIGGTFGDLSKQSDALLQGWRTPHQTAATPWPNRSGGPFSDRLNKVQKYDGSNTLSEKDITWRPMTIIRGDDFLQTVSAPRAQPRDTVTRMAAR